MCNDGITKQVLLLFRAWCVSYTWYTDSTGDGRVFLALLRVLLLLCSALWCCCSGPVPPPASAAYHVRSLAVQLLLLVVCVSHPIYYLRPSFLSPS